jgi:hypothetical protein
MQELICKMSYCIRPNVAGEDKAHLKQSHSIILGTTWKKIKSYLLLTTHVVA